MIASLYLNEASSYRVGGGNDYDDSLEFVMNAIYENEIVIQRSEIELLESSYIHEGAGEAIKNFFKKIKDAISKLIHKVIDFFKRIFGKATSDNKQFYKFSINNVKLNSCITLAEYVVSGYRHAIFRCKEFVCFGHEPIDCDQQYINYALQDPKNIIQKYLFDKLSISLNGAELDLPNIGKAIYSKIVTPLPGKIKSINFSELPTIEWENEDTYSNNCIAVMKKINNETDAALEEASNIIEKEPDFTDSDINILKRITNNLKLTTQYCGIIIVELAKIAKMQYNQITFLKNTVPIVD